MAELREFQAAAVKRIVERLTDAAGSRRFLLADEVGLGKTLVARGVIERLRHRRRGGGFTVVYICSNSEIADQNRGKLCDEPNAAIPGRLTLLTLQSQQIARAREDGQLQVFAFTPGTSLQVKRGTGIAMERRLILYLLCRIWRKRVNQRKWRDFFCCGADPDRWLENTRFRRLRQEFFRTIAGDLQSRLKQQWSSQCVRLVDPGTGREDAQECRLSDCIDACVEAYSCRATFAGANRNRIIGELRNGLARVALEFLEPNLIVLDEFQRFSDILLESRDETSIVGKLFARGAGAILILSATPYKMYTLSHENEDHHQDFLKTLAFLRNESPEGPNLARIQKDLRAFREHLARGDWAAADDRELFDLRERIEDQLKEVMCRTERNWYLEDAGKGVAEMNSAGLPPQKAELVEYVHLRRFLLGRGIDDWNITDFWKSSPSVLSFMDNQYGLISRIRRDHLVLPAAILRPSGDLPAMAQDHAKCRLLFEKVFGEQKPKEVAGSWKYLWVRPTYTYYKDTFYGDGGPTKFLVFSHWRFVPKAVSVLTSQEALKRIGRVRRKLQSAPLQFRQKIGFYPFDVCYPSLALARCVDPLQLACQGADLPFEKQLFAAARQKVLALLAQCGVQLSKTKTAPLWRIMARVEARSASETQIRAGLSLAQEWKPEETSEYLSSHADQYLAWMDSDSPLSISRKWVDRLTEVALYSPAVSLLRSFLSVFPEHPDTWPAVLRFCLGPLRQYLNRRLVQLIMRRHGSGDSYTERILSYCQQGHLQAVLDEYAYLVRHVLQRDSAEGFLDHMGRAMGMWSSSPKVNERTRSGHMSRRPQPEPAHFALAFGDDVSNEATEAHGKTRKSAVREAFNSPFWPFVLATTSVGQEGLDFHLYCRDIIHWNLPSNPVDLEQREGRINRYDGLSIRRNIGNDFPLTTAHLQAGENLWSRIFRTLEGGSRGNGRFKHGLFPHWVYQPEAGPVTGIASDRCTIRRHLLFYAGSRDRQRYAELKNAIALYRLVFGQPRQQDILERVVAQHPGREPQELTQALAKYMINLSPFSPADAERRAEAEAERLLCDPEQLQRVLLEVLGHMAHVPQPARKEIQSRVEDLVSVAGCNGHANDEGRRRRALTAILYLLDPYDAVHDRHGVLGHADDVQIIRKAHSMIFRS